MHFPNKTSSVAAHAGEGSGGETPGGQARQIAADALVRSLSPHRRQFSTIRRLSAGCGGPGSFTGVG
jgi:hypothetical protein